MPEERMIQMLSQKRIGYLCTAGAKNQPHITPIFCIYDHKMHKIYFQANRNSKKIRDIQKNPKVSLTVDTRDVVDPFNNEGVMVQGEAAVLEIGLKKALSEDMDIALDVFMEKFYAIAIKGRPDEKVTVRVDIRKTVYWRGPKFYTVSCEP